MPTIASAVRRVISRGALAVVVVLCAQSTFAVSYFADSAGGDWATNTTWHIGSTSGPAPGAGVYPGSAAGDTANLTLLTYTVTINSDIPSVIDLQQTCSGCTLDVQTGGTLRLGGATSNVGGLAILSISGGTIINATTIDFAPGSDFNWAGGLLNGGGTTNLNRLTTNGSRLQVNSGVNTISNQIVNVNGEIAHGGGNFNIDDGSQINVLAGGLFETTTTAPIMTNGVSGPAINNAGLFRKSAAGGTNVTVNLNNTGTVRALLDTLVLGGTPSHSGGGVFDALGGEIEIAGSPTFGGANTWSGTSNFKVTGNITISVGGNIGAQKVTMAGGTISGPGTIDFNDAVTFDGGAFTNSLVANIEATSALTVTGVAAATISNSAHLTNDGSVTINAGAGILAINNGGHITNNVSKTINVADVTVTSDFVSNPRIDNSGTLAKIAGVANALLTVPVNNNGSGIVSVSTGTLRLNGGGTHTGVWNALIAGTKIDFSAGTHTFNGGSFTGPGGIKQSGGILDVDAPIAITQPFAQAAGVITGNANLSLAAFTWNGGTMNSSGGTGQTVLTGPATFDGLFNAMVLSARTLTINGGVTVNYTPAGTNYLAIDSGANLSNFGTFNINGDVPINSDGLGGAVLNINAGAPNLTKAAGTGFSRIAAKVDSTGAINVNSGQLAFNGGGTNGGPINIPAAANVLAIEDKIYSFQIGTVIGGGNLGFIRVDGTNAVLSIGTLSLDNVEMLNGQIAATSLTINKKLAWSGGKLFGSYVAATTCTVDHLSPTMVTTLEGGFTNNGTFNYDPGAFNLLITNSTVFTNAALGIFNIIGDRFIAAGTGSNGFINFGLVKKTGGSSGTRFDLPLQNVGGTISSEVAGAPIIVNGGGAMTGGVITTTLAGATVDFFGGFFNVSGGTFTGTGMIRVVGTGDLFINANVNATTTLTVAASGALLEVTVSNTFQITNFDWTAGTLGLNGTVRVNSTGKIGNTNPTALVGAGTLTNAGVFSYDADATNFLTIQNTAKLNNEISSTFNLRADGLIAGVPGTLVSNSGTFKKILGTGLSRISAPVTHTIGSFGATTGTLQLLGGSTLSAAIDTGAAAKVSFSGGTTNNINAGASITGTGTIELLSGTTNFNTAVTIPNLSQFGGTLAGTGAVLVNGGQWDSGSMTGSGTTTINTGATFDITNATARQIARSIVNNGTVNDQANGFALEFVAGGTLTNNNLFESQLAAGAICTGCGTPTIVNSASGTFRRNGIGSIAWMPPFNNDGFVDVQNGQLQLPGTGSHTGSFTVAAGTRIEFSDATFSAASSINGTGEVWFLGSGTTNVDGAYAVTGNARTLVFNGTTNFNTASPGASTPVLVMVFSTLGGSGDFTITGNATPSTIDGANITGSGAFTVAPGATFNFTGGNGPMMIDGRVLTNDGTLQFSSPSNALTLESVASIVNNGLFALTTDAPINNGFNAGSITNGATGSLKKSLGSGTQTFAPDFTNNGTVDLLSGTLDFTTDFTQNAGTTKLGGGNLQSEFTVNLNGGTLVGNGTIDADVGNGATIAPGDPVTAGKITITGTYTQTGALNIKLGGLTQSTQYDFLELTHPAAPTLGGSFTATLFNGFTPANGNTFDVIAWNTAPSTTFASVTLPPVPAGTMTDTYLPLSYQLQGVAFFADLSASHSAPASVNHGQNAVITITVTNGGPDPAAGVTLAGNFANASFVTATSTLGSCTPGPAAGQYSCNIGALGNGASAVVTLTLNANTLATITHSATASSSTSDPNGANNSTGTANITVNPTADLTIGITDAPDPVDAGANTTYTVTITNAGPDAASSVSVALGLTNGSIVSATSGTFACTGSGSSRTCTAASLAVTSGTITVVAQAPPQAGTMSLGGVVTATTFESNTGNNSASQSTTVNALTDVSVVKVAPASAVAGAQASFTVTVTNNGPSDATNVIVTDPTPAGTTFVSNSGGCVTAYPCNLGTLLAGQSVLITSTYSTPPNATGFIDNTATVTTTTPDPNAGNNIANASVAISQSADLSINKSGPSTLGSSPTLTYTIFVANNGPSNATSVVISDPTPAGLTFVSNSGACTTSFPCALGNLAFGASATITSTYTVVGSPASITNTATVSSSTTPDPIAGNNSDSVTTNAACPTTLPVQMSPFDGATDVPTSGTFIWSNVGGTSYSVYLGPLGAGCAMPFASTPSNTLPYSGLSEGTDYEWRIEAINPSCPVRISTCTRFRTASSCNSTPATLIAPANGSVLASPIAFSWSAVANATSYKVFASVGGGASTELGTTGGTSLTASLPSNGPVSWFVVATVPNCPPLQSAIGTFTHCTAPARVIASVVGESTSGHTYQVGWESVPGATRYEIDEASNAAFTDATTRSTPSTQSPFTHNVNIATAFFYRVRAFNDCNANPGPYSLTIRVVIIPILPSTESNPNINVPAGSTQIVVQEIFIPGDPGQTSLFTASVDRPWLGVTPPNGTLPPEGVTLRVTADPSTLPNGTFTGTVVVVITPLSNAGMTTNASTSKSVPISISLVTPVTPVTSNPGPVASSIIIPSVGHLDGVNSHWQSDIRLSNVASLAREYQFTFTPGGATGEVKQTTIRVESGDTTALDDIVRNWYGIGSLGDGANGVLEIHALDDETLPPSTVRVNDAPSVDLATAVSSRTYNVTANGTLGQHIPGIPFANFIGKAADGFAPVLSIQQIAQSALYRTNVGLVEAAGQPTSVLVSVFNSAGTKLLELPFDLLANEQRQLNALLAQHNLTVDDGRLEVRVTSGEGKVTAYASTIDNATNDPLLVSPVQINSILASKWVLPGVADLKNSLANWQTDMRVFNAGTAPQNATLTYHPQNNGVPISVDLVVQAGEVRTLDNVLSTFFATSNTGGAVHVATSTNSSLVVTGRTFNQTSNGTFGQFIPAVTPDEAVGTNGRTLQILQVEDSTRFRTNLGLAEVTGKPVTAEVQIFLPDSKVSPVVQIPLEANEFRQFGIIRELGLGNIYNARISVRVIDGEGRVTAYGSVIDDDTQDPTYVKAQ